MGPDHGLFDVLTSDRAQIDQQKIFEIPAGMIGWIADRSLRNSHAGLGEMRMGECMPRVPEPTGASALGHMEEALRILDELELPADIGAHLDLAINRLRDALQKGNGPSGDPESRTR